MTEACTEFDRLLKGDKAFREKLTQFTDDMSASLDFKHMKQFQGQDFLDVMVHNTGCTGNICLLTTENKIICANIGDSRCVLGISD